MDYFVMIWLDEFACCYPNLVDAVNVGVVMRSDIDGHRMNDALGWRICGCYSSDR